MLQVTILTRNPETLKTKAPHLAQNPAIEILIGDVKTFPFPSGSFSHVIHAATESSVELNQKHPMLMFDTIVEGPADVLILRWRQRHANFYS